MSEAHGSTSRAGRLLGSVLPSIVVAVALVGCASSDVPSASARPATPTGSTQASTPAASNAATASASASPSERAAVWLDAGDLREPRRATNVALVGGDEVLIVGSNFETTWNYTCGATTNGSDSVEIGDPHATVWEPTTSLPSLRDAPAVVGLADGRALLTGGAAGEDVGWSAYSSTYLFDPTTRLWSRSGLMNTARTHTGATALLDGRVLVAGGLFMDRASEDRAQVLDSGELWDPRSGAWVRTRPLAGPRFKASAVTLTDGRVLIVGGSQSRESDPIPLGSTEIYDPPSDRWSSAGTLAVARRGFALVALPDGGALVVGGLGGVGRAQSERVATVERFDAATKEWSRVQDLPYPVVGASAIRLADGRVLVAGGSVRPPELLDAETGTYVSGLTADALLFDPRTGRWTATTPMPIPRADASAVVLSDGSVVLVGGSAAEGEPNSTPGCSDPQPEAVRYVPGS